MNHTILIIVDDVVIVLTPLDPERELAEDTAILEIHALLVADILHGLDEVLEGPSFDAPPLAEVHSNVRVFHLVLLSDYVILHNRKTESSFFILFVLVKVGIPKYNIKEHKMQELKLLITEVLSESNLPWTPETQRGRDLQGLEGLIASQVANSDVNKNVADLRDIDDGTQKKLRDAEAAHGRDAENNFDKYTRDGGDKSLDDLRMPFNPRKAWEKEHRAEWEKAHPKPRDDFRH